MWLPWRPASSETSVNTDILQKRKRVCWTIHLHLFQECFHKKENLHGGGALRSVSFKKVADTMRLGCDLYHG